MSALPVVLTQTQAPGAEPCTAAEVRDVLRLDDTTEDALLGYFITAARQAVENYTGQAMVNRTLRVLYDGTPDSEALEVPAFPLVSVSSVEYMALGETAWTTLDAASYRVDTDGGRIILAPGYVWPSSVEALGSFRVTFVAGYGAAASAVPQGLREAVKLTAGALFENRGQLDDLKAAPPKLPGLARLLCQPFVRYHL